MRRLIFALAVLACGCGGGGGGGGDTAPNTSPSDSLFRVWIREDHQFTLDLRGFNFDTPTVLRVFFVNGSNCDCTATVHGDNGAGNIQIVDCQSSCNSLENGGAPLTYTEGGSQLNICDRGGCSNYF